MTTWKNADPSDLKRLAAISTMLDGHPKLITFLFHPSKPELNDAPKTLQTRARAFSSGERVLINVGLDLWSDSGDTKVLDLFTLDSECLRRAITALIALKR